MDSYGLYVVRKQEPDLVPPPQSLPPSSQKVWYHNCPLPRTQSYQVFSLQLFGIGVFSFASPHLTYPLTARVVGAPQMISQPVSSIYPVLHCPVGLGELLACLFPDVVFPPLLLSAWSSFPFHCAL